MTRFLVRHAWMPCVLALAMLTVAVDPARPEEEDGAKVYNTVLRSAVIIFSETDSGAGLGSGALVDARKKVILTAEHVVHGASFVFVYFAKFDQKGKVIPDWKQYQKDKPIRAKKSFGDARTDLAILELESVPAKALPLPLAKESPEVGQKVITVGNPGSAFRVGGLWIYTEGTVREVKQDFKFVTEGTSYEATIIETNSPNNHGDSGGPLVNAQGELLGVVHGGTSGKNVVAIFIDQSEIKKFLTANKVNFKVGRQPAEIATTSTDKNAANTASETASSGAKPGDAKVDSEAESKAVGKLNTAKRLIDQGFKDDAREKLQELLTKWPKTNAASEAKELLDQIKKGK